MSCDTLKTTSEQLEQRQQQHSPLAAAAGEIDHAEQMAQIVMGLMRGVVDVIRSVDAFAPIPSSARSALKGREEMTRIASNHPTATTGPIPSLEDVRLMPVFGEANLIDRVASVCDKVDSTTDIESDAAVLNHAEMDRYKVVHTICIPLLSSLAECYAILDMEPQEKTSEQHQQPQHQEQGGVGRRSKMQKPKPPRGLLSIADYTDVACILEFLVCTSLLPNLERSILPTSEERVRFLPKSLGGRLYRKSLLWGECSMQSVTVEEQTSNRMVRSINELRQTATAIGRIVTLERFRPMLLPRHAADVMAALFQTNQMKNVLTDERHAEQRMVSMGSDVYYNTIHNIFLGRGASSRKEVQSVSPMVLNVQAVDPHTRARAYQMLLAGGKRTPQWLRRRVGSLLNSLAASNLRCVVDVFVVAASSLPADDVSAASARLGRVLCAVPFPSERDMMAALEATGQCSSAFRYYQQLFSQLALLLDIASTSIEVTCKETNNLASDPRVVAGVLTVWAVIGIAPHHVLEALMLPILANGLVHLRTSNSVRCDGDSERRSFQVSDPINRLYSLFSFAPRAAIGLGKAYQLLLMPLQIAENEISQEDSSSHNVTVLGQLIRVVATAGGNVVERPKVVERALLTLRMVVYGMSTENIAVDVAGMRGRQLLKALSLSLVDAVCVNPLDIAGISYQQTLKSGGSEVRLTNLNQCARDIDGVVRDMDQRARVVVVDILARLFEMADQTETGNDDHGITDDTDTEGVSDLPNVLFCLLLLIYFSGSQSETRDESKLDTIQLLPRSLQVNLGSAKLASMAMLPLCCEFCSPSALILGCVSSSGDSAGSFGVLGMIKVIITSTASRYQGMLLLDESEDVNPVSIDEAGSDEALSSLNYACCVISSCCSEGIYTAKCDSVLNSVPIDCNDASSEEDVQTLMSVTSIVVSLLVAMLELGEEKRSAKEEKMLSSLVPALQLLSSPTVQSTEADETSSRLKSEIAEMASHAAALIHSRGVGPAAQSSQIPTDVSVQRRIQQAEQDLHSEQPPIRARGVVALRQIARGYIENGMEVSDSARKGKPLVVEIGTNDDNDGGCVAPTSDMLMLLVRLSLFALDDDESYVYLAAVQTLVAIADSDPANVLPLLAQAVSLGCIDFSNSVPSREIIKLPPSQRIKATEALLFAIKRRGKGAFVFGQDIVYMMLCGSRRTQSISMSGGIGTSSANNGNAAGASAIQVETESFFNQSSFAENDGYIDLGSDNNEERRLRINTGGPIFDTEEDDVVRAGCIAVVAELLSALPPSGMVRYCSTLMQLAQQVLRLDSSRPMRRSAAWLSRELYSVVVREFEDAKGKESSLLSFATAMVSCDEDSLHATLHRCIAGDDVDIVGSKGGGDNGAYVQGKVRLADPATMARCQEALAVRASIDDMGIFAAAKVFAASDNSHEGKSPTAKAVIKMLGEGKRGGGGDSDERDSVEAMRGLQVDADTLGFK